MGCLTVRLHRGTIPPERKGWIGRPTRSTSEEGIKESRRGRRPARKPLGSGHRSEGVAGEGRRAGPPSDFPSLSRRWSRSPGEAGPHGQLPARRWLRTARRAAPPPRGAQSPALTQPPAQQLLPWRERAGGGLTHRPK